MKGIPHLLIIGIIVASCTPKTAETAPDMPANLLIGTWILVSGTTIQGNDTTYVDYTSGQKGIKIINETHFSFLRHDLTNGKDSTALFVAGGGPYTLTGDNYTEHLEFCNYREWEDHSFDFTIEVTNDTLIQNGVEKVEEIGIDRITIEKYVKINK